ncbi:RIB43A-like with coiled-coils protein 2 isoform X1 [Cyprinodon tularosa]|uniref:RIB43A-like with coiled-coils protein 2 isoform X1 n=1 Tax=Cyprinodon tularosa TaxID=77115 RepID=UPI0018E21C77|nr:RIB43A-like with coiled-coils protein 2 isoform X1 [Cyprinodon tularosa]
MFNGELISERVARESVERRRKREMERKERIFNDKLRTMGVDKDALDMQMQEKKRQEEAAKGEQNAYDAAMQQYNKAACLIQRRQDKEKRKMEKAMASFWHQNQQPSNRCGFDLNDPDATSQMVLANFVGEDPEQKNRQQRQREQLRAWLIQQQEEQEEDRQQQKLEGRANAVLKGHNPEFTDSLCFCLSFWTLELNHDQRRVEMDKEALKLQNLEMEKRKADSIAITTYNLGKLEEKGNEERQRRDEDCVPTAVGVPGLCPSDDRRPQPETLQQVTQFQQGQIEEKKRLELEKKREEDFYNNIRLDSARKALLMERQQARMNKQLRRHLDSFNVQLAQTQKQRKPDLKRGNIEDSFFSNFNTCSR